MDDVDIWSKGSLNEVCINLISHWEILVDDSISEFIALTFIDSATNI